MRLLFCSVCVLLLLGGLSVDAKKLKVNKAPNFRFQEPPAEEPKPEEPKPEPPKEEAAPSTTTTTTTEPPKEEPPKEEPKPEPPKEEPAPTTTTAPPAEEPKPPAEEPKPATTTPTTTTATEPPKEETPPSLQPEPVHEDPCVLGTWIAVEACSASCGKGLQKFHLTVAEHADAVKCGQTEKVVECNNGPCPVDCVVDDWVALDSCSRDCGGGIQNFVRKIVTHPGHGGRKCPSLSEARACNNYLCHQDCEMSDWFACGECSAECGPGSQMFCRNETKPDINGGRPCAALKEKRSCFLKECPVDCATTAWEAVDKCSHSCAGGVQHFQRHIVTQPKNGGRLCPATQETRLCERDSCPSDCTYTNFVPSLCSKPCGGGFRNFTRTIKTENNARGRPCTNTELTLECNSFQCSLDCQVSDFVPHGACTAECGGGTLEYTRVVLRQAVDGGRVCPYLSEHRPCNLHPC